jgi:hypothetical protein
MQYGNFMEMKPGESREVVVELPPGARPGDVATFEMSFTCDKNRRHIKKFEVCVGGEPPEIGFACDCNTLWGRLRRFFQLPI